MGAYKNPDIYKLRRGTSKRLAWQYKLSYASVVLLHMRFYLFDELELEALVAAHCKLLGTKQGYLARTCSLDLHPPRPATMAGITLPEEAHHE